MIIRVACKGFDNQGFQQARASVDQLIVIVWLDALIQLDP